MTDWNVTEGTGWIDVADFGTINPRRDDVDGGRHYFTAVTADGGYAQARGPEISGGPETIYYEPDQPFFLRDAKTGAVVEVTLTVLPGGKYAVKSRPSEWPTEPTGGGWS